MADMSEEGPNLRLVGEDEREPPAAAPSPPPEMPDDSVDWRSTILPLCIGVAVLVVGLALAIRLLHGSRRSH